MGDKRRSKQSYKRSAAQERGRRRSQPKAPLEEAPFELDIEGLSHDGRGIARWREKTLFVSGALPTERVTAKQTAAHGRFNEAKTVSVIRESADRITPPCQHYKRCGGCDLQHQVIEAQVLSKQTAVLDQIQRWGGLSAERVLPPLTAEPIAYRAKARLAVHWQRNGQPSLGFREAGSKQIVPIQQCPVLDPRLNRLIKPLETWLESIERHRPVTHIELVAGDESACVIVRHNRVLEPSDIERLSILEQDYDVVVYRQQDSGRQLLSLEGERCDPRLRYALPNCDLTLAFHPMDFIQVNLELNRRMVNQALDLLQLSETDKVADLFCGVGNFTLPMAKVAREVIGIEAQESMVERGRENAGTNGLENASFMAADLEKSIAAALLGKGKLDAMLLDPPRNGAAGAMPLIAQLLPSRIVYISCNPSTLARDAGLLAEQGYRLDTVGIMDMFPQTSHVETMALFVQ